MEKKKFTRCLIQEAADEVCYIKQVIFNRKQIFVNHAMLDDEHSGKNSSIATQKKKANSQMKTYTSGISRGSFKDAERKQGKWYHEPPTRNEGSTYGT